MPRYRFPTLLARLAKVALSVSIVLLALAFPIIPQNSALAIEGVCVMYCDDGDSGYEGNSGYGGGGCATTGYDDSYYGGGVTNVGDYHPDYPNVVWDGEYWQPADGYHYVSDAPDDYRVARNYGAPHPVHPNVVWDGEYWQPADGYHYVSDAPDDYRVERNYGASHPTYPNVVWDGEYWQAEDGFHYVSDDPNDYSVERDIGSTHADFPNTYWDGSSWKAADGYIWASDDPEDLTTIPRPIGASHPGYPNTSWNGDAWTPAEGYVWASDDPDDLRVLPEPELVQEAALSDPVTLPTSPSLRITDVPSPSGYKTETERREQLAKLSDDQIDRELARIRQTLTRMQADFTNDTRDLNDWLKESQQAEDDALKDSFGLLIGGSLDKFADTWAAYPRLKAIASDGWEIAGKLEQAIKMADNPLDISHYREQLRDKMMESYKILVESGSEAVSEQGPKAIALAKFVVDYSYHMTRWGLARNQIHAISDNLDGPNGKLEAQLAIKELQEDLFAERERRLATAQ